MHARQAGLPAAGTHAHPHTAHPHTTHPHTARPTHRAHTRHPRRREHRRSAARAAGGCLPAHNAHAAAWCSPVWRGRGLCTICVARQAAQAWGHSNRGRAGGSGGSGGVGGGVGRLATLLRSPSWTTATSPSAVSHTSSSTPFRCLMAFLNASSVFSGVVSRPPRCLRARAKRTHAA